MNSSDSIIFHRFINYRHYRFCVFWLYGLRSLWLVGRNFLVLWDA
nr:MAG TPA: PTX/LNS-Like (PLL) domain [Caudoviricetes sp.]DAE69795.1 MAG TPA: PTX/LNS-Like (PLL) domain [Caudoviricetes sp.]